MKVYQEGDSVMALDKKGDWCEAEIVDVLSTQYFVEFFDGREGFAFFNEVKELIDDV